MVTLTTSEGGADLHAAHKLISIVIGGNPQRAARMGQQALSCVKAY